MNQTSTLSCKFKDSQGTTRLINIDSPSDNLSSEKIIDFMQYVIDSEILVVNDNEPELKLIGINGASVTKKSVEEITFE